MEEKKDQFTLNPPLINEMQHSIVISEFDKMNDMYSDLIPKKIEMLAKYMGRRVWKDGYYPVEATFLENSQDYERSTGLALVEKVKIEKTYAQRFYPLYNAYAEAVEEIKYIKSTWWFKLLDLFGIIKPFKRIES